MAVGTRVRLRTPAAGLELLQPTGRVVRADEWAGYYTVALDAPARYRHAGGVEEELTGVREAGDNLEVRAAVAGNMEAPAS